MSVPERGRPKSPHEAVALPDLAGGMEVCAGGEKEGEGRRRKVVEGTEGGEESAA